MQIKIYSITSMAWTRMARLSWMIRTRFSVPTKSFQKLKKTNILGYIFSYFIRIVCCMYSLESPRRGDSNEYTQHTIVVYKIEKIFQNYRYLLPELMPWLTLIGSNYSCLERISMVPEMFEPLRFDCIVQLKIYPFPLNRTSACIKIPTDLLRFLPD